MKSSLNSLGRRFRRYHAAAAAVALTAGFTTSVQAVPLFIAAQHNEPQHHLLRYSPNGAFLTNTAWRNHQDLAVNPVDGWALWGATSGTTNYLFKFDPVGTNHSALVTGYGTIHSIAASHTGNDVWVGVTHGGQTRLDRRAMAGGTNLFSTVNQGYDSIQKVASNPFNYEPIVIGSYGGTGVVHTYPANAIGVQHLPTSGGSFVTPTTIASGFTALHDVAARWSNGDIIVVGERDGAGVVVEQYSNGTGTTLLSNAAEFQRMRVSSWNEHVVLGGRQTIGGDAMVVGIGTASPYGFVPYNGETPAAGNSIRYGDIVDIAVSPFNGQVVVAATDAMKVDDGSAIPYVLDLYNPDGTWLSRIGSGWHGFYQTEFSLAGKLYTAGLIETTTRVHEWNPNATFTHYAPTQIGAGIHGPFFATGIKGPLEATHPIPEPGTGVLALGAAGLLMLRRRSA